MVTNNLAGVIAQPATFKQRFLATCLDEILLATITVAVFLPFLVSSGQCFLSGEGLGITPIKSPLWFWAAFLGYLISYPFPYFYVAMFEASRFAATPGKLVFGLKVVSEKNERITTSDGLTKALVQTLVYIPFVVICFFAVVLFINFMGVTIGKKGEVILGLILNLTLPLVVTAALSYPCFRKGSQSFVDLISHRFVVQRNAPEEFAPQPLEGVESAIHWLHQILSVSFRVLSILLALAIPPVLLLFLSSWLPDVMVILALFAVGCITSVWLVWKYRKTAHILIAKAASAILAITLVVCIIVFLPEFATRLANTPRALTLIDQALVANKSGDKKNYEELRMEAKSKPSYALAYYVMNHDVGEKLLGLPERGDYYRPRLWAISSAPGKPFKETKQ